MVRRGRALYNLLAMNVERNPTLAVEKWQIEEYRAFSENELFVKLKKRGITLNRATFLEATQEVDSPEDLADALYQGGDFAEHEQIFLCLFELWRRLAVQKMSPSIFCDELDHLIKKYEEGDLSCENQLQAALLKGQGMLEDHVDKGGEPSEAFELFAEFSCHDLDRFLYEYIAHQIDRENNLYASELLEGFYSFIPKKNWFAFLRARLVFEVDPQEGVVIAERLLEELIDSPDLPLLFEMLHFLIYAGELTLFSDIFERAIQEVKSEKNMQELMMIASDYMNCIEKFGKEKMINDLLDKRKGLLKEGEINPADPLIEKLREWILNSSPT